jgi:hypothetical protein
MAITILSAPWKSAWTARLNPAYNQMPFTVNSTMVHRPNFRYLGEIYAESKLIGVLKHHPDLISKYGIFDVSKHLQNVITTDRSTISANGWIAPAGPLVRYNMTFGEEYARYGTDIQTKTAGAAPNTSSTRIFTGGAHNLRVNDSVYLQLDPVNAAAKNNYNIAYRVVAITTNSFTINKPYANDMPTCTGTYWEAETGFRSLPYTDTNGIEKMGYIILTTRPTRFAVGDQIMINVTTSLPLSWEGQQTITGITTTTFLGTTYQYIKTDLPKPADWAQLIGTDNIVLKGLNNYKFRNLVNSDRYNSTAGTSSFAWNAAFQYEEFPTYTPDTYYLSNSSKDLLTNSPKSLKIRPNQDHTLSFFNNIGSIKVQNLKISYLSTTNPSVYADITVPYPTSTTFTGNRRFEIQVGSRYIQGLVTGAGGGALLSYKIRLQSTGGLNRGDEYTFTIDTTCQPWETYRFVWLNRLSGWDFFEFKGKPLETIPIDRMEYDRRLQTLYNNDWTYSVGDRGAVTYAINATENVRTWSGYIKRDVALWLEELYTSPEIYVIDSSNRLIPIILTSAEFARPQVNVAGLINMPIEFRMANSLVIQNGSGGKTNSPVSEIGTNPPDPNPGGWNGPDEWINWRGYGSSISSWY